jgi:hypothetical protein
MAIKGQRECPQTGVKEKGMRTRDQMVSQWHTQFIRKADVMDIWWTKAVGFQSRLYIRQSFAQLEIQAISVSLSINKDPGSSITESYCCRINSIAQ